MGKINTAANISSAFSNRAAARSGAETSASVGKLATSDRRRELRERGLITHRSTPFEIAAVEARLAAEMGGRMIMQGARYWRTSPLVGVWAFIVLLLLLGFTALAGAEPGIAALFLVPASLTAALTVPTLRRKEQGRADTIAKADWNATGICSWCGRGDAHVVEAEEEHPRVAHAYELEQMLGPLYVEV